MITSATEPQRFFRPGTVARTSDWPVLRAPSPSGVFEVSPTPGGRVPRGCAFAPGDGQLWNPQAAQSARLVEASPRFVPHFVHTSSSWLNLVERWFGELTPKRVRRDSFRSLEDLEQAIREFLTTWNIGIAYTSVTFSVLAPLRTRNENAGTTHDPWRQGSRLQASKQQPLAVLKLLRWQKSAHQQA
jgi:hypothetical protein